MSLFIVFVRVFEDALKKTVVAFIYVVDREEHSFPEKLGWTVHRHAQMVRITGCLGFGMGFHGCEGSHPHSKPLIRTNGHQQYPSRRGDWSRNT